MDLMEVMLRRRSVRIVGILGLGMPAEEKEPVREEYLDFSKVHLI